MAKQNKKKVRHLTVLLLKADVSSFKASLKDETGLTRYKVRDIVPYSGYLYVQPPREKPPAWLQFVQSVVENKIVGRVNASTAAVLFIKAGGRRFAITFGYGRNLLKQESLERDFGLKVALNTVNPDSLRSVDMRTFEDLTLHTRRQASPPFHHGDASPGSIASGSKPTISNGEVIQVVPNRSKYGSVIALLIAVSFILDES